MLTMSANIVTTAITEASLREQIKATEKLVSLNDNVLQIIRKQQRGGTATLAKSEAKSIN